MVREALARSDELHKINAGGGVSMHERETIGDGMCMMGITMEARQ